MDDSISVFQLQETEITGARKISEVKRLTGVEGGFIFSGKKSEVIDLNRKAFSVAEKYGRQIFAKVPGAFIYDMDGTGNQINISTRGLDPHRGWEFNIRKDGIITNSDMYGYPASHYNIPMEAVDRIQLVRGTASLQYGAQFGGMINYISKLPDSTKTTSFESVNSVGSFGMVSTYNSVSGRKNKFRYIAWFNKKSSEGYRRNSQSSFNAENISLFYDHSSSLQLKFEYTHSNYLIRLAGPLNDSMFAADPRSSTRSRNYYNPNIHVPSLTVNWKIRPSTQLYFSLSKIIGSRNSVMFDKPATVRDSIVASTLQYNNRQVDIDHFNSLTSEVRIIHSFKAGRQVHELCTGIQLMNNDLHRQQLGKGTTGSDFDLSLVQPGWGRDLHYKTLNIAVFAEQRIHLTSRLLLSGGLRFESGESKMSGKIIYYSDSLLPNNIQHQFLLGGANLQYNVNSSTNLYAGFSQSYRPVILKDIIPTSTLEFADKNLKDAKGYNLDAGLRGKWHFLKWDLSAFMLQYNNRLGTIAQTDNQGLTTIFRTNIGDSRTKGLEGFLQADAYLSSYWQLSVFTSTSYMDAVYQHANIRSGNKNVDISGHQVESVPHWISRNGITARYKFSTLNILHSYVSSSYADALNASAPDINGATGLVPAYHLWDVNVMIAMPHQVTVRLNMNNVFDKQYFTKRPQFYPGPGIWSSDGRSVSATLSFRI